MPAATLTVGNVEITAILDVDRSMPLAEVFDGSGDPPPGGSESLAARYPDEFTGDAWRFRDHCFLVRMPTRLTLIETGVGPADSAFGRWLGVVGRLPDELAALSTAGLIRSRASWTRAPGRPVSVSDGSPRPTCASTATSDRGPDDGDAGHATGTYTSPNPVENSPVSSPEPDAQEPRRTARFSPR